MSLANSRTIVDRPWHHIDLCVQVDPGLAEDSMPVQAQHHYGRHNHHHHHSIAVSAGPSDGESAGTDTPRSLSPQSTSDPLDSSFGSSGLPSAVRPFVTPSMVEKDAGVGAAALNRSLQRVQQQQQHASSEASRLNLIKLSQIRSAFSNHHHHNSHNHHKQAMGHRKRMKVEAVDKDLDACRSNGVDLLGEAGAAVKDNNNCSDTADANVKGGIRQVKEEPMDTYSPAHSPGEPTKVSDSIPGLVNVTHARSFVYVCLFVCFNE